MRGDVVIRGRPQPTCEGNYGAFVMQTYFGWSIWYTPAALRTPVNTRSSTCETTRVIQRVKFSIHEVVQSLEQSVQDLLPRHYARKWLYT